MRHHRYPIEALLRPPIELWSAVTAGGVGLVAVFAPGFLMMTPKLGYGLAALLFLLAFKRAREAWYIIRYQRNLKHLPRYRLTADKIPVSDTKLFLGKGFRWRQQHTQRLRDTQRPWARKYVEPGPVYHWARRMEVAWEKTFLLRNVAQWLAKDAWWNPVPPLPPVGGKIALHAVEPDETEVWMPLAERVGHTLVLGTTRVGKTRLAEILITQDIRRGGPGAAAGLPPDHPLHQQYRTFAGGVLPPLAGRGGAEGLGAGSDGTGGQRQRQESAVRTQGTLP